MITGAGKTGSRIFFQSAASKKLERASELYDAYKAWSEALKDYTRSEKDFSAEMEKLGISKRKSHGINTYFGLRLNDRQNRSNRWYDNEIL